MGVDKSYGSGRSRSAAESNARARVAAGRFTKGPKRPIDNLVSKSKTKATKIKTKKA